MFRLLVIALFAAAVGGCSATRETLPKETANEQLLLSRAVDRAVAKIRSLSVPKGNKIYVDTHDFDAGQDTKYAVGSITGQLLKRGYEVVPSKAKADTILVIRSGALSINQNKQLWFGVPSVTLPIPLAGPLKTPELDLFKSTKNKGVAKFGLTFYNAKTGALQDSVGPIYGYSHYDHWVFLMVGWTTSDLLPSEGSSGSAAESGLRGP